MEKLFRHAEAQEGGEAAPFITGVSPPGYRKKAGRRTLWTVLRNDQYKIGGDKLVLKGLGAIGRIETGYRGIIHLKGEQGRLEIRYNPDRRKWYAHISFKATGKAVRGEWSIIPKKPLGNLVAGIDTGINNLIAVYVENGLVKLANGRPLKAVSHYWRMRIAKHQSTLNGYGLKTSRRLRLMHSKWRSQVKSYINNKVRETFEWLYSVGVSIVNVGYPKNIAQENGDFHNVHVWTYGYLLKRISEVAEEYGITVVHVDEAYTSSKCPLHGHNCGKRIKRGLFKCTTLNKVLNADLVGAYNILITPSPERVRVMGRRPGPGPSKRGDVAPNLPALAGTLAL